MDRHDVQKIIRNLSLEDYINIRKHILVEEILSRANFEHFESSKDPTNASSTGSDERNKQRTKEPIPAYQSQPTEMARSIGEFCLLTLLSTVTPYLPTQLDTPLLDDFLKDIVG